MFHIKFTKTDGFTEQVGCETLEQALACLKDVLSRPGYVSATITVEAK